MKKLLLICLCGVFTGCTSTKPDAESEAALREAAMQPPKGFYVDPAFRAGDAVMGVVRRHLSSEYIALTRPQVTSDGTHDYVRFFAGWSIEHGFESVYWRYLIFAKKKNQKWSDARVFDSGSLPMTPFEGPFDLLEQKGRELGKPIQPPVPTSGLRPAAAHL